jgi:hypothetical protein
MSMKNDDEINPINENHKTKVENQIEIENQI